MSDQTQATLQRVDTQLDALIDITGTQKQIAGQMGNELGDQLRIIDGLNQHMDGTQEGVQKASDAVKEVKTSGTTWFAWVLCIILVIAIVVILAAWK
jgi:t-SNARE complex subunit (syntaxin)